MNATTESKATKAESIHSIITNRQFKVKIDGEYVAFDVPDSMISLYNASMSVGRDDIEIELEALSDEVLRGTLHKALTSMIIDCRALTKRVKKDEEWSMELAESNLSEFKIKPIPVPNAGKKEATPEDMVAKLKALGITPEELAIMMAR